MNGGIVLLDETITIKGVISMAKGKNPRKEKKKPKSKKDKKNKSKKRS